MSAAAGSMRVSPDPIVAGEEFELSLEGEWMIGPDFVVNLVEDGEWFPRYRLASVNDSIPVSQVPRGSGGLVQVRPAVAAEIREGTTWSITLLMPDDLAGEQVEICALPEPCGRFSVR